MLLNKGQRVWFDILLEKWNPLENVEDPEERKKERRHLFNKNVLFILNNNYN